MAVLNAKQVSLVFVIIFVTAAEGDIDAAAAARIRKQPTALSNTTPASLSCDVANVSSEEYLKLRRQLKSLNKPAVKSIKTAHGDTFDCVDIYKQPAFDHPLLKHHKIQMWPTSFPKGLKGMQNISTSEMEMEVEKLPDGGCPHGTVPIRRTRMKGLLRNKSLPKLKNKVINDNVRSGHHWATIEPAEGGNYYGALADINVWNPSVVGNQFSLGQLWIASGHNSESTNTVEVGWMVYPDLHGDSRPHLFVYWTADDYQQTGCYNSLCPGFVQVSRDIAPGSPIQRISSSDGTQYYISLLAFKDVTTQNWWVIVGGNPKPLGYFPQSIFNGLEDGAGRVIWGGEVYSPRDAEQPQMGSGHFANEGFGKAAFMKMVMTVDEQYTLRDAPTDTLEFMDEPSCYNTEQLDQYGDENWRRFFFFGGPGC